MNSNESIHRLKEKLGQAHRVSIPERSYIQTQQVHRRISTISTRTVCPENRTTPLRTQAHTYTSVSSRLTATRALCAGDSCTDGPLISLKTHEDTCRARAWSYPRKKGRAAACQLPYVPRTHKARTWTEAQPSLSLSLSLFLSIRNAVYRVYRGEEISRPCAKCACLTLRMARDGYREGSVYAILRRWGAEQRDSIARLQALRSGAEGFDGGARCVCVGKLG